MIKTCNYPQEIIHIGYYTGIIKSIYNEKNKICSDISVIM